MALINKANQKIRSFFVNPTGSDQEYGWSGNYNNWAEAKAKCSGYDNRAILDKCRVSLLKVKNGEAVYERDSVIFDKIQYNWPLAAALLRAALENEGNLSVLDFGGSLGSSYFQNRNYIAGCKNISWSIIEQAQFVTCGKQYFEDEVLKFYFSVAEAASNHPPNITMASGVLQYLEDPYEKIKELSNQNSVYIFIDNMPFNNETGDRITIQNVDPFIYPASYPCWFLDYQKVLNSFLDRYTLISEHISPFTISLDGNMYPYKGFLLKRK